MAHWHMSCILGLLVAGRWQPLCSIVGGMPDSRARRAYCRAMDRVFEPRHVERITAVWLVGSALRR